LANIGKKVIDFFNLKSMIMKISFIENYYRKEYKYVDNKISYIINQKALTNIYFHRSNTKKHMANV